MAKTYNKLDIEINKEVQGIITAVQDDIFSRYLDVNLFDNGVAIDLTGHKVRIYIKKSDGKEIFNIGQITDAENGRVQFELTSQTLAVCGKLDCQIIIYNNEETQVLSTNIFNIFVTKSLKNDKAIESTNEYGALVVLFQDIYEARTQISEILEKIGTVGDKGEEIQKDTLFEQIEYLIDFSEKNSVGSLGQKLDNLTSLVKYDDRSYDFIIECMRYPKLELNSRKVLAEVNGAGYLYNCHTYASRGRFKLELEIDGKTTFKYDITHKPTGDSSPFTMYGIVTKKNLIGYVPDYDKNNITTITNGSYFGMLTRYYPLLEYYGRWKYNGNLTDTYTDREFRLIPQGNFYPLSPKERVFNVTYKPYTHSILGTLLHYPLRFERNIRVIVERLDNDGGKDFSDIEMHYTLD